MLAQVFEHWQVMVEPIHLVSRASQRQQYTPGPAAQFQDQTASLVGSTYPERDVLLVAVMVRVVQENVQFTAAGSGICPLPAGVHLPPTGEGIPPVLPQVRWQAVGAAHLAACVLSLALLHVAGC